MKKVQMKLIASIVILAMLIGMIVPVANAVDTDYEYVIYTFYNVKNNEDLSGKKFIIAGDYKLTTYMGGGGLAETAFTAAPSSTLQSVAPKGKTSNIDYNYGEVPAAPVITDYSHSYTGVGIVESEPTPKGEEILTPYRKISNNCEWTFEKNEDGTYSLYLITSWGEKRYLESSGLSVDLYISYSEKGNYSLEYKDGGKIALKLEYVSNIENPGGDVFIDNVGGPVNAPSVGGGTPTRGAAPETKYVVYDDSLRGFRSGTPDEGNILELYEKTIKRGAVIYDYDSLFKDIEEYGGRTVANMPEMENNMQLVEETPEKMLTVENANANSSFGVYRNTDIPYLEDLYNKKTNDTESFTDASPKSSKIWGTEYKQIAWGTNDIKGNSVVIGLNEDLRYEESTDSIKTKDINGKEVAIPNTSILHAIYGVKSDTILFDIKYEDDLNFSDGTLITEDVDTESLAVGHVYFPDSKLLDNLKNNNSPFGFYPLVDPEDINLQKDSMNSYNPSSENTQLVIEGLLEVNPTSLARVSYEPVTNQSVGDIAGHVVDYVNKYSDELDVQDIDNVNDYDVVWYEMNSNDAGFIASGVMRDMKNFLVIETSFEDISENDIPVDNFKIEIQNEDGDVLKTLTLKDDNVEVSGSKKTFTWKLNDMTENTYTIKQYNRNVGSYTSSTNATTDVDTSLGDVSEDGDVVVLKVSTVNNRKDQVRLVNKYEGKQEEKPQEGGNAPAPAGQPSGGAPASSGPVAQAVQSIYNGLLPKTGSASAFIITGIGILVIVLAIRLRKTENKKGKKKEDKK